MRVSSWAAVVVALGFGFGCGAPPASQAPPSQDPPANDGGVPVADPDGGTPAPGDGGVPDSGDGGTPVPEPTTLCVPVADGPYWVVEGEPVRFQVRCSTGAAEPGWSFALEPLPAGASFDSATGEFSWTPAMNQAALYSLTVREAVTGEVGSVKVGVADAFHSSQNAPMKDPASYQEEFGLPVMHLLYEGKLTKEYAPARLVYRGHQTSCRASHECGAIAKQRRRRS